MAVCTNVLVSIPADLCNGNIADVRLRKERPFRKLRISKNLRKSRIRVVQIEVVGCQIRSINCGKSIITAENFGALIALYSEIGGHVLTPFLGTCLGWQDEVAVCCLQGGLPMRIVADEGEAERD